MNLVTLIQGAGSVTLNDKTGKTGSFARALVFATKDIRAGMAHSLYAQWLANGQYRPLANDIIDTLVPKSARHFVTGLIPTLGPIRKEQLVHLCRQVENHIEMTRAEAIAAGKTGKLSGEKDFVFGVVHRIAQSERDADAAIEAGNAAVGTDLVTQ